jgi:TRAP transporter 4TM/12TM fusion protein
MNSDTPTDNSSTPAVADPQSNHWFDDEFDLDTALQNRQYKNLIPIFGMCLFALWHLATNIWLIEPGIWQNSIHFGGFALLAAVMTSAVRTSAAAKKNGGATKTPVSLYLNVIFGFAIAAASLWVAHAQNGLYERTLAKTGQAWQFGLLDWIAAALVIIGALELTRRLTGWIIPILVVLAMSYILFLGEMLPGAFRAASLPIDDVVFRSLYNDEGMFGIITTISSSNITLFMIFGAFLVVSGASDFVIELAKIVASRFRGGAAFVAVISSALTGTISGSAVANTASTGVITIPLMKSNGFRAQFAAGVEAAASTGGQLMPPIMGAGAFIMASYTGIPYGTIVLVSIVPAMLYFLSVAFIVRIEAVKYGIDTDSVQPVDRKKLLAGLLNFVLPLSVMTTLLVSGYTPSYAATIAIATLIVVSWVTPNKMGPKNISIALSKGIKTSVMTAILLVAVGLINNAVTTSGLANTFALMVAQWSQGSLALALALIAAASLILGMGLPVTAAYIVLSILSAPALAGMLADGIIVEQLVTGIADPSVAAAFLLVDSPLVEKISTGMSLAEARSLMSSIPFELAVVLRPMLVDEQSMTTFLLTAHLIVFWLSQDSNVTPPVCLAAFTAAGIAGSPPMRTGVEAWKIAKGLYIVPLLFAYTPIIGGDWLTVGRIALFSLFGIYAVNALLQRYAEGKLHLLSYPALLLGGAAAFIPGHLTANLLGSAVVLAVIVWSRRTANQLQTAV